MLGGYPRHQYTAMDSCCSPFRAYKAIDCFDTERVLSICWRPRRSCLEEVRTKQLTEIRNKFSLPCTRGYVARKFMTKVSKIALDGLLPSPLRFRHPPKCQIVDRYGCQRALWRTTKDLSWTKKSLFWQIQNLVLLLLYVEYDGTW